MNRSREYMRNQFGKPPLQFEKHSRKYPFMKSGAGKNFKANTGYQGMWDNPNSNLKRLNMKPLLTNSN